MKKNLAEYLGSFILVFCGTGAIVINETTPGVVGHAGIAITFGLIVMALIYALGDISGAHLNPAVTLAFAAAGLFEWRKTIPYIVSQSAGAISASMVLHFLFPSSLFLGATLPIDQAMPAFILEIILTFILMFVILQVAYGSKEQGVIAGAAIGAIVLLEAYFAGPISGASMNPARSLGPAIVSGHSTFLWIYLTAPFIGALLAVPIYTILKNK